MSDPFFGVYLIGFVFTISFGSLILLVLSTYINGKFGGRSEVDIDSDPLGLLLFNSLPAIALILFLFRSYREVKKYV